MDINEFEKLIVVYQNTLKRLIYYKTPNKSDGDDVLQETLLAAFKHHSELKNSASFKAWIFSIANNKCRDFYRVSERVSHTCIDEIAEKDLVQTRQGFLERNNVYEALNRLGRDDKQILQLYYLHGYMQHEISKMLKIPIGTVKSRLYNAKKRFSLIYLSPKGGRKVKKFPDTMPTYSVFKSAKEPFMVKWEELAFWFIVPSQGEKAMFGFYDLPDKVLSGTYTLNVTGQASVHGVFGVEIMAQYCRAGKRARVDDLQVFTAQLTDTHCRWLSECHYEGEVKRLSTFLDDDFLENWGFGTDNCGVQTNLKQKGTIKREGNVVSAKLDPYLTDIVGRYDIVINNKSYDCVCVLDLSSLDKGVVVEHFIDSNGRAVLERRYNSDDWRIDYYKQRWSERLPKSEQLIINGKVFVCWYECISDYVL